MSPAVQEILERAYHGDGKVLPSVRLLTGLSEAEAARLCFVSPVTFRRWLTDRTPCRLAVRWLALLAGRFPSGLPPQSRWSGWAAFGLGGDGRLYAPGLWHPQDGATPGEVAGLPYLWQWVEKARWRDADRRLLEGAPTDVAASARVVRLNGD